MARLTREEIMKRSAALFPIVPIPRRRAKQIINIKRLGTSLISALPIGLGAAVKQLAAEVIYRRRHLKGLRKARKYRERKGMAMHVGCGNNIKDGWVNIDLTPAADLLSMLAKNYRSKTIHSALFTAKVFWNT